MVDDLPKHISAHLQKYLSELQSVLVSVVVPTKLLLALGKEEANDFFMTTTPHLFNAWLNARHDHYLQ